MNLGLHIPVDMYGCGCGCVHACEDRSRERRTHLLFCH